MEHLPINDLPNELLEMIFDHLNGKELKDASLVCRRWLDLVFIGRRIDRVMLMPTFPWNTDLLQSKRKYRHIELGDTDKCSAHVKELFQAFSVSSLRIKDYYLSRSALRLILLEVPNLQHLSIWYEPRQLNEMSEPLPVMRKLERLEISNDSWDTTRTFPWHTIAPLLHGLKMDCNCEEQLEQWRLFSGQLKEVYVTFLGENSLNRFCEMTFPLLEELSIKLVRSCDTYEAFVQRNPFFSRHEFFRRNGSLRRLSLGSIHLSKTLVKDITNHCKKLTYLEIKGYLEFILCSEPGSLQSLSHLPELKHLRLANLGTYIFHGCEALTSLQSLSMTLVTSDGTLGGTLGFLEHLFQIAPQLRCLELGSFELDEKSIHFICNNFTNLTRLQLPRMGELLRDFLFVIDRLPLLWLLELYLTNRFCIGIVPFQSKVRYLALHLLFIYDEDNLHRLPEIFPHLDRLSLINWDATQGLRESAVDRLRQLLPTCAIKIHGHFITNAGTKRRFPKWTKSEIMPVWEKEWIWNHPNDWI